MKRVIILLCLILLVKSVPAPGTAEIHETQNVSAVNSIMLEVSGERLISWNTDGYSKSGFKIVWSKNEDPVYPTREGDKYYYYSSPKQNSSSLEAFNGAGIYYVRVCEYIGGKCGIYSNQIAINITDKKKLEKVEYTEKTENKTQTQEKKKSEVKKGEIVYKCNGCDTEGKCYPIGYRKEKNYCSDNLTFKNQSDSEISCDNNFECQSNLCVNSECISEGLLKKIKSWFTKLFG